MTLELKPFSIGGVKIEFPVVLAALAGYSDPPFRMVARSLGAPYCATEMLLDKSLLSKGKAQRRMTHLSEDDHPIAGQIIGGEPHVVADAAALLCRSGFDVIDLNFACPVRKTLARRRGGYLMKDPDRAVRIVRAVMAAVDRPVTLKLRRAFRENDTGCDAFWRIAAESFDAGVAAICLHGRSVEAKYTGPADWDFLAAAKRRFAGCTIVGSGDVLCPADALRMMAETGVDAVAVARGALGNPWFFRQVRDLVASRELYRPGIDEQGRLLAWHFEQACELYGEARGSKIMRKFGIKYARNHGSPRDVRAAFVAVKRPEDWRRVLEEFYGPGAQNPGAMVARTGPAE